MPKPRKGVGWTGRKKSAFRAGCNNAARVEGLQLLEEDQKDHPAPCATEPPIASEREPYFLRSSNKPDLQAQASGTVDRELVLLDLTLTAQLITTAVRLHRKTSPRCVKCVFQFSNVTKFGFGRKAALGCTVCGFETATEKLYQEVRTGQRGPCSALPNLTIPAAALQSPIGLSPTRHLLLAAGLNPMSRGQMQKQGSRAADKIVDLVEDEMRKIRQHSTGPIDVAHDTTYNNRLFSSSRPGQGGTQATSTTMDLRSGKILHVETASKLCPHRGKCELASCQFRNVEDNQAIGDEEEYALRAARVLKEAGVQVRSFTSDGDSKAFKGFQNVYEDLVKYKDTIHLNRSMVRQTFKETFSHPSLRLTSQRKLLGCDLVERVNAEFQHASRICPEEDKAGMRRTLQFAAAAAVDCYEGDHRLCDLHSFVCKADERWPKTYLPPTMHSLAMTQEDRRKLKKIMFTRLGVDAIEQTHRGFTTQHVEAFNKRLTKSAPKSLTCSRNYRARVLTSVCRHNSSLGQASRKIYCSLTGQALAVSVGKALEREEKEITYSGSYKKRYTVMRRRRQLKQQRFRSHASFQEALSGRRSRSRGE